LVEDFKPTFPVGIEAIMETDQERAERHERERIESNERYEEERKESGARAEQERKDARDVREHPEDHPSD
jgi:hypothetical protein